MSLLWPPRVLWVWVYTVRIGVTNVLTGPRRPGLSRVIWSFYDSLVPPAMTWFPFWRNCFRILGYASSLSSFLDFFGLCLVLAWCVEMVHDLHATGFFGAFLGHFMYMISFIANYFLWISIRFVFLLVLFCMYG